MNGFIVRAENRPGELARLTEALAAKGVNILVHSLGLDGDAALGWIANDEDATRSVLADLGVGFREVPLIFVAMEDKPGQTAAASRKLADAGVNIEFWLPVDTSAGSFTVAIGVDRSDAAELALSNQLTAWSYT